MKEVRVRFAPSPTGMLHIGGVRTALYNYLFAKKHKGKFILRIEDTDQSRLVHGAEKYIKEALAWCGIQIDEGVSAGGEYAPYKQSERQELYQQYVQQLLTQGKAYYAFDTAEALDKMREKLKKAKANSLDYNTITRNTMTNSLTLAKEEVEARLSAGDTYVIRIKIPIKEDIRLHDMIRGWVNVHSSAMDDKVLMKSDGMPTYHLANVVDDYLMKISHVIRGEEWLPSAPLHILLYKYLGWEKNIPQFAHLPLLLKPNGKGKLSKRDAAKHGFPIFPLQWKSIEKNASFLGFKEQGYLSKAFVNFVVLLGWNPGTEQELFTINELIEKFSIERISKAGAKLDINKAIWFNQQYIRALPTKELGKHVSILAKEKKLTCTVAQSQIIATLLQERIDFIPELISKGKYFFNAPDTYVSKVVRKKWNEKSKAVFNTFAFQLGKEENMTAEKLKQVLAQSATQNAMKVSAVMQILRVAITGEAGGPDLMKIMVYLGTKEVASRIDKATAIFDA